jgi:probable HAF family extracellular repeat protein
MRAYMTRGFRSLLIRLAAVAAALAVLAGTRVSVNASTVMYTVTDLGALGCCTLWGESNALALNNLGDVVGVTGLAGSWYGVPFLYHNGAMTAISEWTGDARGINDSGQVAGSVTPPGEMMPHAFLYQDGLFTDLGALPGYSNQPYALAYAINSSGMIVGDSKNGAFVYQDGVMRLLKRLSARVAYAVNDGGDVVGLIETVRLSALSDRGFLYHDNVLIDIGTVDGSPDSHSIPMGINNKRQVVGMAGVATTNEGCAFLYENGSMRCLGTLRGGYSYAQGINNNGEVVGSSDLSTFVYRDGVMIDLNDAIEKDASGRWPFIYDVRAINDRGQIAGTAWFMGADGVVRAHACLLTPVSPM